MDILLSKMDYIRKNRAKFLLICILCFSIFLHFFNWKVIGGGNRYYIAAITSMLHSPYNYFFTVAEPGGSLTVDKPPLGLWIQGVFTLLFGTSAFTISLPNILSGIASAYILYLIVKKQEGEVSGIIAAFIMTISPIYIATNRSNTIDGTLLLFLMLAVGMFYLAVESKKTRWLYLGAVTIGLAFQIKMVQALFPVPALVLYYLYSSEEKIYTKIKHAAIVVGIIVFVSLSWMIVVDLIPSGQRPFVGSTLNNSARELIFTYNGAMRIFDNHTPFLEDVGKPGVMRFFIEPLSKQLSWFLPLGLLGFVIGFFQKLEKNMRGAPVLWGAWLFTCLFIFSFISGVFHPYYTILTVPPLSALVGITIVQIWKQGKKENIIDLFFGIVMAVTLLFQQYTALQYINFSLWIISIWALFIIGATLLIVRKRRGAYISLFFAITILPAYWAMMTILVTPNSIIPTAYPGKGEEISIPSRVQSPQQGTEYTKLVDFLQKNTREVKYLAAVPSAEEGQELVISTKRPVFYIGGYSGIDGVGSPERIESLVRTGQLKYIIYNNDSRAKEDVSWWITSHCSIVSAFSKLSSNYDIQNNTINGTEPLSLYGCERDLTNH